jgi:hypothetical protein
MSHHLFHSRRSPSPPAPSGPSTSTSSPASLTGLSSVNNAGESTTGGASSSTSSKIFNIVDRMKKVVKLSNKSGKTKDENGSSANTTDATSTGDKSTQIGTSATNDYLYKCQRDIYVFKYEAKKVDWELYSSSPDEFNVKKNILLDHFHNLVQSLEKVCESQPHTDESEDMKSKFGKYSEHLVTALDTQNVQDLQSLCDFEGDDEAMILNHLYTCFEEMI